MTEVVQQKLQLYKILEPVKCFKERYETINDIIDLNPIFASDERKIIGATFRDYIHEKRNGFKQLNIIIEDQKFRKKTERVQKLEEIISQLASELKIIYAEILSTIECKLIPGNSHDTAATSYYTCLRADIIRYLCEITEDENELKELYQRAKGAYNRALELAQRTLSPTHPLCLTICLNCAVMMYEHIRDNAGAIALAQKALDEASIITMEKNDDYYTETIHIREALRENLTNWTHNDIF